MVPVFASLKRPSLFLRAPVKAPATCPKRSLSIVFSFKVVASRITYGLFFLNSLSICRALPINSLPVPVSPVIKTGTSIGANKLTWSAILRIASLKIMKSGLCIKKVYGSGGGEPVFSVSLIMPG